MHRRKMLQLMGAALAATVGTGYTAVETGSDLVQDGSDPVEFEDSEELLLDPALLPGDGWEQGEVEERDILDVGVTFQREIGEEEEGEFWIVTSAAAGRDTETEATDVYQELYADFSGQVGEARIMDLDLASEAAIAGYDGLTRAIFRDVNCVGSIGFASCTRSIGCFSHVDRGERLARTKQESWRGAPADSEDGDDEDPNEERETAEDEPDGEYVDEVERQVTLAYGETAQVSNGVEVTVYEGTLYDQMGDDVPEDRDRFLVVPVEAENTSDEPRRIPDQTDSWDVLFGDQQVGNVFRIEALDAEGYEPFEGGDVQEGVRREGVLLFEVDEGYETEEIDVLWQDSFLVSGDLDGDIDVRWTTDG